MRASTRLWIDAGTASSRPSSAFLQQLFEKERIAVRPFDARERDALGRIDEAVGEIHRLVAAQRAEVDRREWRAAATRAPGGIERIALDARGHHEQPRPVGDGGRHRGEKAEHLRIGPVHVLDDDHRRTAPAGALRERRDECALAAVARGVVHRVVERAPFARLRQVEQVVQEHELVRADVARGHHALGRRAPFLYARCRRESEQAADDRAHRVLASAHAEVEHAAVMDREAERLAETPHLVDEPRLADARLAAHIDGLSRERRHARARDAPELFELRLAADEETAAAADVRAFACDAA